MLGRVIFCVVIAAAILAVVLLATVSPLPHRSAAASPRGLRDITVYVHPAPASASAGTVTQGGAHGDEQSAASALVFSHRMTAGPEVTSRAVGAASGFVLPGGRGSAMSAFDTVHLSFDAPGLSGSLCVEAASRSRGQASPGSGRRAGDGEEVMRVVGGTGVFAFARGRAVFRAARLDDNGGAATATATALRLELSVVGSDE